MNIFSVVNKVYYFFLCRRYRIKIIGEDLLKDSGAKFIIPNHPAQIDAQILGSLAGQYCEVVPVVSEHFVNMPIVGLIFRRMGAISVSDISAGNRDPHVMKNIFSEVMTAFENGKSPILYPAGQIKTKAAEHIGNKQSAYRIITEMPANVPIIGVKITGLWGSIWSSANRKSKPKFGITFIKSVFYTFANLVFFTPKREVSIEFIDISENARLEAKGKRHDFNKYLEKFYNSPQVEEATYIRHFFYLPRLKR
ncbi:1-acyl-sn-glycerol-3-phosphate acyltransferase [Crocinitomix catalasitica]|nr:1-acyl-sn-glycerol-3-phosphate acyltransferase [Crocinitomix catalasitica]